MGDEHSDDTCDQWCPTGSVLGPTLFFYFINDMPDVNNCLIKIFADDTKVYTDALSLEQKQLLQSSVDRLLVWSNGCHGVR